MAFDPDDTLWQWQKAGRGRGFDALAADGPWTQEWQDAARRLLRETLIKHLPDIDGWTIVFRTFEPESGWTAQEVPAREFLEMADPWTGAAQFRLRSLAETPELDISRKDLDAWCSLHGLIVIGPPFGDTRGNAIPASFGIVPRVCNSVTGETREHPVYERHYDRLRRVFQKLRVGSSTV